MDLSDFLKCSRCGDEQMDFSGVRHADSKTGPAGEILCKKCGHRIPIKNGVLIDIDENGRDLSATDKRNQYVFRETWAICPQDYNEVKYSEEFDTLRGWKEVFSSTLLDAGCGSGRLMELWAECGAQVVLFVDVSDAVFQAREKYAAHFCHKFDAVFIKADVKNMPIKTKAANSASSVGVLHHTTEQDKAMQEILRIAKNAFSLSIVSEKVLLGKIWISFNPIKPLVNKISNPAFLKYSASFMAHGALLTIKSFHYTGLSRFTTAKESFGKVVSDPDSFLKMRFLMLDLLTAPFYRKFKDEYYIKAAGDSRFDLSRQVTGSQCEYFLFTAK